MRRILIILVLAVLANGCGGDGSGGGDAGGGTSPDTQSTPTAPPPSSVQACPKDQPLAQTVALKYALLVDVCTSWDRTSLSVKNVSSAVLRVWPAWWRGAFKPVLIVKPPDENSLAVAATGMAVGSYTPRQGVLVAPGARVVASSMWSFKLDVVVVRIASVSAYAAKLLAEWVEKKLGTPGQRMTKSVANCAQSAATVYETGRAETWREALGDAVAGFPSCRSLVNEVNEAAPANRRPPTGAADDAGRVAADDIGRVARRVSTSAWDEFLKLAGRIIRVAAAVR
jgi:hypothetical protein